MSFTEKDYNLLKNMLYLFESTHVVINAEKKCLEHHIACKIIPVPRTISSECGMAIEISSDAEQQADAVLNKNNIKFTKYYDYKK